jgi:hypothetical protein
MYPNTSNIITNPSPNKSNKLAHAIIAFILVASAIYFFSLAPQNFPVGSVINIPEKSTLNDISKILKENHVIFSEFLFQLFSFTTGQTGISSKSFMIKGLLLGSPPIMYFLSSFEINNEQCFSFF